MGTLGFLLPFRTFQYHESLHLVHLNVLDIDDFDDALESVFAGRATILNRMRLACMFYNKDFSRKSQDADGTIRFRSFLTKPKCRFRLASHERDRPTPWL